MCIHAYAYAFSSRSEILFVGKMMLLLKRVVSVFLGMPTLLCGKPTRTVQLRNLPGLVWVQISLHTHCQLSTWDVGKIVAAQFDKIPEKS